MTNTLYDPSSNDDAAPKLGALFAPLFKWHGQDVYPVFGAEGEDEGDDDSDSETDDDADDDAGNGADKDGARPVTREEFDKLRKQLSASDKGRAAAEKRLKEAEDAKKDDLTKATDQVAELTKAREQDAAVISELRMQNAFLTADTGITWHDPADALALAEKKGYLREVVDEDGTVDETKLKAKLLELAKAKPHLVKKDGDGGSNGDGAPNGKGSGAPTGGKVGGGKGKPGSKDKTEIPSRYQSLLR